MGLNPHFVVLVQVQQITPARVERGHVAHAPDKLIERQVDEVIKVIARADAKEEAVEKALRMLRAEQE